MNVKLGFIGGCGGLGWFINRLLLECKDLRSDPKCLWKQTNKNQVWGCTPSIPACREERQAWRSLLTVQTV